MYSYDKDRYIDTTNLKKIVGSENIFWQSTIGKYIKFHYKDIDSEVLIIECKNRMISFKYNNVIYTIKTNAFKDCRLPFLLERNNDCSESNQEIENNTLPIIYDKSHKLIINCEPWMMNYFVDENDAYKYTYSSTKEIKMRCPFCGRIKPHKIAYLYKSKHLPCPCGDGWSYPNKFVYYFLESLHIYFETEKQFEWSQNRIYDDYIVFNNKKIIIENHGEQHYKDRNDNSKFKKLEFQKNNDSLKKKLALENGIDLYFEIDCRESSINWMKNSIIKSGLLQVLGAEGDVIAWDECAKFASSNMKKYICDYVIQNCNKTYGEIASELKLSYDTVKTTINEGRKIGWITDEIYKYLRTTRYNTSGNKRCKPLYSCEDDMYFASAILCEKWFKNKDIKISCQKIATALNKGIICGNKNNKRTLIRITKEEFNKTKNESPDKCVGDFLIV